MFYGSPECNCSVCFVQDDWDQYGVDYGGPVPLDNDENTVIVDEIDEMLSPEEKSELRHHLENLQTDVFSQRDLLSEYLFARGFVSTHVADT